MQKRAIEMLEAEMRDRLKIKDKEIDMCLQQIRAYEALVGKMRDEILQLKMELEVNKNGEIERPT